MTETAGALSGVVGYRGWDWRCSGQIPGCSTRGPCDRLLGLGLGGNIDVELDETSSKCAILWRTRGRDI